MYVMCFFNSVRLNYSNNLRIKITILFFHRMIKITGMNPKMLLVDIKLSYGIYNFMKMKNSVSILIFTFDFIHFWLLLYLKGSNFPDI